MNKVYKVGESDTDYVYIASSNYETNQSTMKNLGDQVDYDSIPGSVDVDYFSINSSIVLEMMLMIRLL